MIGTDQIPVVAHLLNPNVTVIYATSYSEALIGGASTLPAWLGTYLPLLYLAPLSHRFPISAS